jgi:hypothetical protein
MTQCQKVFRACTKQAQGVRRLGSRVTVCMSTALSHRHNLGLVLIPYSAGEWTDIFRIEHNANSSDSRCPAMISSCVSMVFSYVSEKKCCLHLQGSPRRLENPNIPNSQFL